MQTAHVLKCVQWQPIHQSIDISISNSINLATLLLPSRCHPPSFFTSGQPRSRSGGKSCGHRFTANQSINEPITQPTVLVWTVLTRSSPAASRGLDRASTRGKSRGTKCVARRPPTSDASWPGNNMQLGMVTCMYLCMHVIVLVDWARNCRDLVTLQGCHVS